jgi:hypothetical protein
MSLQNPYNNNDGEYPPEPFGSVVVDTPSLTETAGLDVYITF